MQTRSQVLRARIGLMAWTRIELFFRLAVPESFNVLSRAAQLMEKNSREKRWKRKFGRKVITLDCTERFRRGCQKNFCPLIARRRLPIFFWENVLPDEMNRIFTVSLHKWLPWRFSSADFINFRDAKTRNFLSSRNKSTSISGPRRKSLSTVFSFHGTSMIKRKCV